jgi:hypothetical protein
MLSDGYTRPNPAAATATIPPTPRAIQPSHSGRAARNTAANVAATIIA